MPRKPGKNGDGDIHSGVANVSIRLDEPEASENSAQVSRIVEVAVERGFTHVQFRRAPNCERGESDLAAYSAAGSLSFGTQPFILGDQLITLGYQCLDAVHFLPRRHTRLVEHVVQRGALLRRFS